MWGREWGVITHSVPWFTDLQLYSQLFHTYSIRQEMDDYKWNSMEEIGVYLGHYTNIHHKKNKQYTFLLPRRHKVGNFQICVRLVVIATHDIKIKYFFGMRTQTSVTEIHKSQHIIQMTTINIPITFNNTLAFKVFVTNKHTCISPSSCWLLFCAIVLNKAFPSSLVWKNTDRHD